MLGDERVKEMIAAEVNEHDQPGKVVGGLDFGHDPIFNPNGLFAVVVPVLQVNVLCLIERHIEGVNAFEIVTGLFFKIG